MQPDKTSLAYKLFELKLGYAKGLIEKRKKLLKTWGKLDKNSFQAEDLADIRAVVHELKGSGKTFGFNLISVLGAQLESVIDLYVPDNTPADMHTAAKTGVEALEKAMSAVALCNFEYDGPMESNKPAPKKLVSEKAAVKPTGKSIVRKHILVVDDAQFVRMKLAMTLKAAGFETTEASSGQDALKAVSQSKPDLILLDVNMPGMSGYEIAQKISSEPSHAEIPIVMLTAEHTSEAVQKAIHAGASGFIVKPFETSYVIGYIKEQLTEVAKGLSPAGGENNQGSDNETNTGSPKVRVLVVEDSPSLRIKLGLMLQESGFKVLEASDGLEAVERARMFKPHVVLMDIQMPNMNGYQATATIRKEAKLTDTKIIMLTGNSATDEVKKAISLGANDYIVKPFDIDHVVEKVFEHAGVERINIQNDLGEPHNGRAQRVLIVENDGEVAYSLKRSFQGAGYEVSVAKDGAIASVRVRYFKPDIIVMETQLPEMNGFEVTRQIRQIKDFAKTPIVLITPKGTKKDIEDIYVAGGTAHLVKPLKVKGVRYCVKRLLSGSAVKKAA